MSLADVTSARSSPEPEACPECDTSASVTSDLHKYQVACTCKPASVQYACADDPGPAPPAKTDTPPALPPRPPTSVLATNRRNNASVCNNDTSCRRRKYAWWCCGCGALAAALGGLLAAQHILLRAYTASPQHLETVPAAVPAAMLVLTGVCIMSLARRRNRYSYMIKVVGACCLVCALTCVLVTITTTVIHMNKLQTLKFCEYTKLTRTCTCFSMPPDTQHSSTDDEGVRCVFEGVSECGVVHGALYWCLRGVFALSVSAVLVCIFSCMLAYQLLSHERKKMYWEQLELRCRSLYRPPSGQPAPTAGRQVQSNCSCCTQCHPTQPGWDISLQHRFWAPGRIGNLYSPNPGTGRKTSAWSWFPWPRSNSQNSRCQMGVPQSGDSAYGFCDSDAPPHPTQVQNYEESRFQGFNQFRQGQPQQFQSQQLPFSGEGFAEAGGSIDAQTGVWGPPPPYSPQGRSGSRYHLHQDPAAATLLHHHHIDVHNSMTDHHTCARASYLMNQNMQDLRMNPDMARMSTELSRINPEMTRINPELARINPELARINPELARMNPELARMNPELARINPELARINPEIVRINSDLARHNQELARMNPELARINPDLAYPTDVNELARMQELSHLPDARFNTLRGHLIPYRTCQRSIGMSAGNIHRDCRDDGLVIECMHQKSASKVSDQSTDSGQKQGKENLGFQNDKHSPMRSSMQDCHRAVNQNAESEVYFADVSSCCNVSVKADCCLNPNVSALVGTIENHPESTSESDTSFTLTRQQRPQPQVGSKRRPRQEKHKDKRVRTDIELNHARIERMNECRVSERDRNEPRCMNERCERNESRDRLNEGLNDSRISERMSERVIDPRVSDRLNDSRIDRMNERICDRMNETRMSDRMNEQRLNDSRISDRMNDSRISDRMNETRMSERMSDRLNDSWISERNDPRICDKINDTRMSERMNDRLNDSRISERNDPRLSDRMNETRLSDRISDRMNESRISDKINEARISDRLNESRFNDSRISERINDSRISDRVNDSRISDRMNDSRISDRMNDSRISDRMNDSRISDRVNDSRNLERMNETRLSERIIDRERINEPRLERMSDLNSSVRIESPKRAHISPLRKPQDFEAKPDFQLSPLSPGTEESVVSDGDGGEQVYCNSGSESERGRQVYCNTAAGLNKQLKPSHHHCYSDTNTMDSGCHSGEDKQ